MTLVFVYKVDMKDTGALKKALDADTFADDSFVKVGYTLKESQAVGLKGGSQIVYFKTEEQAIADKLKARLKEVASAAEVTGADKDKVVQQIESEQDSAAAGIGSIFG